MHKPINRRYYDIDDSTKQSGMSWDMSDGHEIVVPDILTYGETTDGKAELTAIAQEVCDNYEEAS